MTVLVHMIRREEVPKKFMLVESLLSRVVAKAEQPEFTVDDLYTMAVNGTVLLAYAQKDGEVVMAGAFEIIRYPRLTVLNVMALCGKGLMEVAEEQAKVVHDFAEFVGADYIQASCTPSMARLLKTQHGFVSVYEVLRIPVRGANNAKTA